MARRGTGRCLQSVILRPRTSIALPCALLLAALLHAPTAGGEEPRSGPPAARADGADEDVGFFECGLYSEEIKDGERVGTFVEGVVMRIGALTVEADSVVVWADPDKLRLFGGRFLEGPASMGEGDAPAEGDESPVGVVDRPITAMDDSIGRFVDSIYAEGNVRFRIGTGTIHAERLYADFHKRILVSGRVTLTTSIAVPSRGMVLPIVVRAERLRRTAENELTMEDAHYTTCDFEDPHYRFRCSEFVLSEYDDHSSFTAYNNVIQYGPVPFFYLPVLGGRSDLSARPLRSANLSRSSRFGTQVELLWGDDLVDRAGDRWGEWRIHSDWRSLRGPGIGPEVEYKGKGYEGEFRAYYQRDRAEEDGFNDTPVPRRDRGRVRLDHRQQLDDRWRIDLSLRTFSDRNYQPEYLKDEFLEERDPDTWATLRYADGTDLFTLTARPHVADFRTETEALPEAAFHRIAHPFPREAVPAWLLDDLTWSLDASAGYYERRYDEATGLRDDERRREDVVARLEGVRGIGPVRLQPFFTAGVTREDGGTFPGGGGSRRRGDMAAGARATVEARRDFPSTTSEFLQVDGLRHRVSLDLLWYDRFAVNEPPSAFTPLDAVETVDDVKAASARLRNRFQTDRSGRTVDWLDLELRAYWFPEGPPAGGTPLGLREGGLLGPRFQDLHEEEKFRASPLRGPWGPWEADMRMRFRENIFLLGEAEWDPYEDRARTAAIGVRWFVVPRMSLYLGDRRIAHDSDIYTFRADWAVSDRWTLGVTQQADLRSDRGLQTSFRVTRVMHDFIIEVSSTNDGTSGERTISFSLTPTALWVAPTSAERLGRLDYDAWRWYR